MNKITHLLVVVVTVALCVVMGALNLSTPAPVSKADGGFSAERMSDIIKVMSENEHSVFQYEERMRVRDYIVGEFEKLGLTAEVYDYIQEKVDYSGKKVELPLSNILVKIEGKNPTAAMVMAHYDSRGVRGTLDPATDSRSKGAADDGYGVATMVELARLYAGKELTNSLWLLVTDLEEVGLFGAEKAVDNLDLSDVNLVINLEARGVKGPAYMFETSDKNYNVMKLYSRAKLPMSYSIAAAAYRQMPNGTDFTPLLDAGKAGMNFAVLNSLYYYHTPNDNFDNISLTSMQHYGAQLVPMLDEYLNGAAYSNGDAFVSSNAGVFFTLLPNVFVLYTDTTAIILSVFFLIMAALVLAYFVRNGANAISMVVWLFVVLLAIVAAAVFGLAISFVISLVMGIKFSLTYMPLVGDVWVLGIAAAVVLSVFGLVSKKLEKRVRPVEMFGGAVILLAVLNVVLSFALPEASFLFLVPQVVGLVAIMILQIEAVAKNPVFAHIMAAIPAIITALVYVPLLYSFLLALTVGALAVYLALFVISVTALVPLWLMINPSKTR